MSKLKLHLKRLRENPEIQQIVFNCNFLVGDRLFQLLVGLVVNAWVARTLGAELFGQLSFAMAIALILSALGDFGLSSLGVKILLENDDRQNEVLGTIFVLRTAGSLLVLGASLLVALLLAHRIANYMLLVIVSLTSLTEGFRAIDYWFQSKLLSRYIVASQILSFSIASIIRVVLVVQSASVTLFAIVLPVEAALNALLLTVFFWRRWGSMMSLRFSPILCFQLIRTGFPLVLSTFVKLLMLRIDQIILQRIAGDRALGIYSCAVRIAEVALFVPSALYSSLFPRLFQSRAKGAAIYHDQLARFYELMSLAGYLTTIVIVVAAIVGIPLLYGHEFQLAVPMCAILTAGNIFIFLGAGRSAFLMLEGLTLHHLICLVAGCLVTLILSLLLIPIWNGYGAAVASIIGYAVAGYVSSFASPILWKQGILQTRALVNPWRCLKHE